MSTNTTPIRAIAEIVINVVDLQRARTFYETVLGFQLHSQYPADDPTIVFLTIQAIDTPLSHNGHPQLFALIDPQRHPPAKARFQGVDVARSSLNHLAFEIDAADYQREQERLTRLGLTVSEERFSHMQAKALFFQDPEGNTLEFICPDAEGNQS